MALSKGLSFCFVLFISIRLRTDSKWVNPDDYERHTPSEKRIMSKQRQGLAFKQVSQF